MSSGGGTKTQQVSKYTPAQERMMDTMLQGVSPYVNKYFGSNAQPYQMSGEEQNHLNFLNNYDSYVEGSKNWINPVDLEAEKSKINGLYGYGDEMAKQAYQTMWDNSYKPQWYQNIAPEISSQYAGPGYWGTARANALTRSLNDTQAQVFDKTYTPIMQSVTNARNEALGGAYKESLNRDSQTQQIYATLQAQKPEMLQQAAAAKNTYDNLQRDPYIQLALKLLGEDAVDTLVTNEPTNNTGTLIGSTLGLLGTAAVFGISTKELKDNITLADLKPLVDELLNVKVYKYNYKPGLGLDSGKLRIGPVTEELPIELTGMERKIWDTQNTIGLLIATVQQQQAQINQLLKGA